MLSAWATTTTGKQSLHHTYIWPHSSLLLEVDKWYVKNCLDIDGKHSPFN